MNTSPASSTDWISATGTSPVLEQASQLIRSSCCPLLLCHVDPDGDAIGSLTGLGRALRQLGKQVVMACADPVPPELRFIPDSGLVVQQIASAPDLVVFVDCSEARRIGPIDQFPPAGDVPLINIDHHVSNVGFGTINVVDARASSTAEIVLRLLDQLADPIDTEIAMCLLTGIVTDTRGFRTSNVTVDTMEAALRLMKAGASLNTITQRALDWRSVPALRLWGAALASTQVDSRIIWAAIPLEMSQAAGIAPIGDAGLASFIIGADGADAAAVFVEQERNHIDVGLRAAPGFDISQVATRFGGGGHALAAGCALPGTLDEVQERVLVALRADLARQRQSHGAP